MRKTWLMVGSLVVMGLLGLPGLGQEKLTERTLKLGPDGKSPPATLADVAWMAGRWTGEAFGGEAEEVWSGPKGGAMMGMFRLIKDGKPSFYELIVINEENGSLVMRLKHFNADMTGWEEKDKTVDFPLVAKSPSDIQFNGLTIQREGENAVIHYLAMRQKDGTMKEAAIRYVRVEPAALPSSR